MKMKNQPSVYKADTAILPCITKQLGVGDFLAVQN